MKSKRIFKRLFIAVLVIILAVCLYNIYLISKDFIEINRQNKAIQDEYIADKDTDDEKNDDNFGIKWNQLLEANSDVIAWIYIPEMKINYPIVQGRDNNEYLRRNLKKEYSKAGTVFVDSNNTSPFIDFNTVIYGHNLMNNGNMFSDLKKFANQSFADAHQTICIYFPNGSCFKYKVVSFRKIQADNSIVYSTAVTDKNEFINEMKKNNKLLWNYNDDISSVITLSTCTNIDDNERYVLHAVYQGREEAQQ